MELMTQKKASEYLGIDPATLYRWIKVGSGPKPIIIAGRKWFTKDGLDSWAKEGQK
jgi:predicted site-specific integrase-resolvase